MHVAVKADDGLVVARPVRPRGDVKRDPRMVAGNVVCECGKTFFADLYAQEGWAHA